MLKGKTVILGITGSIAAYKMANVASMLKKLHCNVEVIMTKNAVNFINPITFETLTGNKCLIDTFDRNFQFQVEHISLAKRADLLMVAPASANIIGKLANGIADDMLTTTALACTCQKIIAPAMNTNMYLNPIVQDNMKRLQNYGFEMVEAASGHLACGDSGIGKLPEEKLLVEHIVRSIAREKDMKGMKVLVSAGATMEAIDPVRKFTTANVIFLDAEDGDKDKVDFIKGLKEELKTKRIPFTELKGENITPESLKAAMNHSMDNVFIPTSGTNVALIKLLPQLIVTSRDNPDYRMQLFGYPEWQTYTTSFSIFDKLPYMVPGPSTTSLSVISLTFCTTPYP